MSSCLYVGEVSHLRLEPCRHGFGYPVYFYGFDLDDLPNIGRRTSLFGYNRLRLVSIRDADYLAPTTEPIESKVRSLLAQHGCDGPAHRIHLVTCARYFNYVFNPVSFFLVYDREDILRSAVVQVNNTFGDRHIYVLPSLTALRGGTAYRAETGKDFHVSPFFDLRGNYEFVFHRRGGRISIAVNLRKEGRAIMLSRWTGDARPLGSAALAGVLLRYPLSAALTMPRIVMQAARLKYRRGLAVYRRPEPRSEMTVVRRRTGALDRLAVRIVCGVLATMRHGRLDVTMPDGTALTFGDVAGPADVRVRLLRYDFFRKILFAADMGLGESYVDGDFECEDLTRLLEVLAENQECMRPRHGVLNVVMRGLNRVSHLRRRNDRANSRRNIEAHYDLSNDFFRLFLDSSMTYSCAMFRERDEDLESAQARKLDRIIELARIEPHHHVLEIGSGWGSLAMRAALTRRCRVTSLTVSQAQYDLARRRVTAAGLDDRVEIRLCDYRDMRGRFDRIVSIEMLEAVGHEYLPAFFKTCDSLLNEEGLVVLQVITIPDQRYEAYRRSCDWIQKYVFPGGHLPSLTAMTGAMTRASRLMVESVENIGPHYATTLRHWRERFMENLDRVRTLGFDERFMRIWLYYLAYCEAGFAQRLLNDLHLVLTREGNSQLPGRMDHARPDTGSAAAASRIA